MQRAADQAERQGSIAADRALDPAVDDPLRAARGILFGLALAVVGCWLPLSVAATRLLR